MTTKATHKVSPQEAAQELIRRDDAAQSLIEFAQYVSEGEFQVAQHHRMIADALERVERGEIDRLMIFMPPRHGKSQLASRLFPAWYLGRNTGKQIITASYSSDLSSDFGREVRNLVGSVKYHNVFPGVNLRSDSKAANRWHTDNGGVYVSAGVCTAITGRGAHLALIDDPFKDRQEADSDTRREHVWRWYQSTLYTRLMPGGAVVVIQTRWHDDDLAGRLLHEMDKGTGDRWEILELPAINAQGEALWPEWFDIEALERIQSAIGPREWSALYQQRPQPEEGTYFQKGWFQRYEYADKPQHLNIYIASDFAVSEGQGDYTEHGVFGTDSDDNLYVLDWWSGQKTADVWIDALCDLFLKWRPHCWFGESGPIRRAIEPFLTKRMLERQAYCRVEWIASTADKPTRARSFQARASMGKVFLPYLDWAERLLAQLLVFPAGKHDDAVDVCSLMGMVIDQSHPAVLPPAKDTRDSHQKRLDSLLKPQVDDPFFEGPREIDPWTEAMKGRYDDSGYFSTVE